MQRASTSRLKTAPGSCLVAMLAGLLVTLPAAAGGARGSVLAWGCQDYTGKDFGECTVPAAARSGVTAIAAGYSHSIALKQDGSVVAWGCRESSDYGSRDFGQCTVPAAAKQGVKAIAASGSSSLALTQDGRVLAWGCHTNPDSGQCDVPTAAKSGVTEIAAGPSQSLALTRGGRVLAWGCRGYNDGQCDVPAAATSGVTAIAAGTSQSLALEPAASSPGGASPIGGNATCHPRRGAASSRSRPVSFAVLR